MREAQEFLEEMSQKGFNPPVRGRDLLIDGLLNAGYLESAKGLVRKMTKEGFVPDVGTFNSLAEAICKTGKCDFCIDLFNDVCRSGLCPDIETYKIVITAASKLFLRRGQFDDAFSFFSDMKLKEASTGSTTLYHVDKDVRSWRHFLVDSKPVDIFWDLKTAKFNGETEPSSEYYVAVVCDEEVILLLGDLKKDAYRKTGCR
ncbi:hypothetical protein HAX54_000178 [Datura stramonium]|uniref:Pentatricopeptide repeat-containing protein n=1 Tax=Datura stramonium TaxID=4076 RepID=A0ABS8T1E8_DATST|nr:hypothetical protein [Datura stramonium]